MNKEFSDEMRQLIFGLVEIRGDGDIFLRSNASQCVMIKCCNMAIEAVEKELDGVHYSEFDESDVISIIRKAFLVEEI